MELAETPARRRFATLIAREEIPLVEAALAIAGEEYPHLTEQDYLARIEELAASARRRLPERRTSADGLRAVRQALFEEAGFRGNEADYYDPRNSFLNEVLDRKLGIPISLSVLFLAVARQVGLEVEGVPFPGHFLVKHRAAGRELFIDPYRGGELLTAADCAERYRALTHGKGAFDPRFLEAAVRDLPPPRSLFDALSFRGGPARVIAEVKRASPSAGSIDAGLDAAAQALRYAEAGAAAVSILTDGPFFGGSLADLAAARRAVEVPLLRKDFILDRYQLLEARLAGADAALLIVAALSEDGLLHLLEACGALGLSALVEVHDEPEVGAALEAGARIVGVNNRDLRTFKVDLATSERLLPLLPERVKGVSESGIRTAEDARRLRASGAANLLVGEALVRAPDPGRLLRELVA